LSLPFRCPAQIISIERGSMEKIKALGLFRKNVGRRGKKGSIKVGLEQLEQGVGGPAVSSGIFRMSDATAQRNVCPSAPDLELGDGIRCGGILQREEEDSDWRVRLMQLFSCIGAEPDPITSAGQRRCGRRQVKRAKT
jgi:hypothetical protein